MTRGRLWAYLPFQLGDYLLQRASVPLVLVLFVAGLPIYATLHSTPGFFGSPQGPMLARQMYSGAVALFLPLGAFLAGTSLVSVDRRHGYVRFFFSKPVNVVAYYVQTYLLHGLAFVALFGLVTWAYGLATLPQRVPAALAAAALTFVLIAGLGLLGSTLTRFDGVLLALLYIVSMSLQQIVAMTSGRPQFPAWAVQLSRVLPPAYKLDQLREHLYAGTPLDSGDLWLVLGYGLGAFVLGLVALRKLPLSR